MWRNEPIPIPRLSSLPRGGRTVVPAPEAPASPSLPSFESLFARIAAPPPPPPRAAGPPPASSSDAFTLRSYFLVEPTSSARSSFFAEENGDDDRVVDLLRGISSESVTPAAAAPRPRDDNDEAETNWTIVERPFARPRPARSEMTRTDDTTTTTTTTTASARSREETNSLAGRALRSRKRVYLVYCGGENHNNDEETVPNGFDDRNGRRQVQRGGCGALLCARGLVDGVPNKVFDDAHDTLDPVGGSSSDLPPSTTALADLVDDAHGLGERVGKRGWRGCKGCVTRDLGCRKCGNHVGYRLLRPDVFCSIARHSGSGGPWRRLDAGGATSTAGPSAGGVTGGGVVDGLLFHFRGDRTTSRRRRIGIPPRQHLDDDDDDGDDHDDDTRERASETVPGDCRLRERAPCVGEDMIWKHIPTPQRDFCDGLVSEPLDWLTPNQETWWLDHSIAKHSLHGGARAGSTQHGKRSTDTLSSATTTVVPSTEADTETTTTRPRAGSGASLSRSHAIRLRVPLAAASSSSPDSVDNYDRYRSEAQTYARRVRQRLDLPSSASAGREDGTVGDAAGAGNGVVASLERAGYGSWYDGELDDDDVDGLSRKRKRAGATSARQSVGR
ncbi:hypothetical protein JCM11491_003112 [Sporobolomyces phaffii]